MIGSLFSTSAAWAESALFVAYPPAMHETTSDRIFLVGTGDPTIPVLLNGTPIEARSAAGHFAPTVPLQLGTNTFTLSQGEAQITLNITRQPIAPTVSTDLGFVPDSLLPQVDLTRQPGEQVCFGLQAVPDAQVQVAWGDQRWDLAPSQNAVVLPPNSAVLTAQNEPVPLMATPFEGCTVVPSRGSLGPPVYTVKTPRQVITQEAPGGIDRVTYPPFAIAEVTAASGTARTGPSTNYSRLSPLPQGTRDLITGTEGEWLRLAYGGWIRTSEVKLTTATAPPQTLIRSVTSQEISGWTEVRFPLQMPVPISIEQTADTLTLTLHHTIPQTDTIYLAQSPVVARLDWRSLPPDQAEYRFQFKTGQQWGYRLSYEGTTLVLSLRHPPRLMANSLAGSTILLDPGHGSENDLGARGPNGYPEKDVTLIISKLLQAALERRGAEVVMTREGDEDLFPGDRVTLIDQAEPTLALSIHYNALPDSGNALNTAGIGTFWYNAQAHDLAQFLHDYLAQELERPSYGVYWNNLALTRPTVTPSVLLELGFMINPTEFEWITDPEAQVELAETLADAIAIWLRSATDADSSSVQ
jgi:N-acetylmuramoyl-L-alanine amidase